MTGMVDKDGGRYVSGDVGRLSQQQKIYGRKAIQWGKQNRCRMMGSAEVETWEDNIRTDGSGD